MALVSDWIDTKKISEKADIKKFNPNTSKVIDSVKKQVNKKVEEKIAQSTAELQNKVNNTIFSGINENIGKYTQSTDISKILRNSMSDKGVADNIERLMNNGIDKIVAENLDLTNKDKLLKTLGADGAYAKGMSLYNKIQTSDKLLEQMKKQYTGHLQNVANDRTEKLINSITNPLSSNKFTSKLVDNSKLAQTINAHVNSEISKTIDSIIKNEDISNQTKVLNTQIKTIQKSIEKDIDKKYGADIKNILKAKENAEKQLIKAEKDKQEFIKKANDAIATQQKKIKDVVQAYENKVTEELNKVLKTMLSRLKL